MATRLSVIVPTTHRWPEVRPCLEALLSQAAAVGGEILVADGDGSGVPDDVLRRHEGVLRVVRSPGASVFELRALAVAGVTADIVAITEDHCIPASDWCRRQVDAYDRDPDLLAVGGAVTNGSRHRLIDRANYFLTFAAAAPPIATGAYRFPPVSNVSFRRAAVPPGELAPGYLELQLGPRLLSEGRLLVDDGVLVEHVQSHGFVGTFAAHYHNGRASTGLRTEGQPWAQRRRGLRRHLKLPFRMMRSIYGALRSNRKAMAEAAPTFPLIALLCGCYTVGSLVGLVLGPGASPRKLA
jgi:hypothetical protein